MEKIVSTRMELAVRDKAISLDINLPEALRTSAADRLGVDRDALTLHEGEHGAIPERLGVTEPGMYYYVFEVA